jgi:HEPN domain-containing protein
MVVTVGSLEHSELSRKHCRVFYEYAQQAFERCDYDTTLFMCEQAIQLCLKSILLRMLGFIPRGHGVRELLGVLSRMLREIGRMELSLRVSSFIEGHRDTLLLIEEAYIASRYLAKTYEREDAEKAIEAAGELIKLLEGVEQDVFS